MQKQNRNTFPECAFIVDLLRDVFNVNTNPTYVSEWGKSKGTPIDYSKCVEPCLNRRDRENN